MKQKESLELFKYLKRDALAGTVAGVMAIPLTAGICLMSDYPIMTGLYTVVFACIVSFVTSLFRPGNYVGVPGVAAGLAPALALGVSTFGMENMPFLIFLTASMQAIVWRFKWEGYILQLVPHYLVEGLLAGVGLKIALKFLPFLYAVQNDSGSWMSLDRSVVLLLSASSLFLFVFLYTSYQKKMPALSYFAIMVSGVALSYILALPMLSIESVAFEFIMPIPSFAGLDATGIAILFIKMICFSAMLASIDVIEQVMSNVAIEHLDPLNRSCDTNNSMLAIWLANIGASFFGGMTNLDGLAKSTTNAVAGAVTKLSNLFTAVVLLFVISFPVVLGHLPKYSLGIIMVFSGWKMIANLANVRSDGKYAFLLAVICGLCVFKLGIFEGLIAVLAAHAVIHFIFQRRLGSSTQEIVSDFKEAFRAGKPQPNPLPSDEEEGSCPSAVLRKWVEALNSKDAEALAKAYAIDGLDIPAFSTRVREGSEAIVQYYQDLWNKENLYVKAMNLHVNHINGAEIVSGMVGIAWLENGFEETHMLQVSATVSDGHILSLHSSVLPTDQASLSLAKEDSKLPLM